MVPEVRPLQRHEIGESSRLIAESLQVEPGFSAVIPDPQKRLKVMTPLFHGILGLARSRGTAYGAFVDGRLVGVACWLPPGGYPHTRLENLRLLPSWRGMIHVGLTTAREMAEMETATQQHFPKEPLWYLMTLGVSPLAQGQGIGSKLIQPVLDRADASGESCYLETGTERLVRFYERFGFQVHETGVQLAPHGPTHWTMIRRPQSIHNPGILES